MYHCNFNKILYSQSLRSKVLFKTNIVFMMLVYNFEQNVKYKTWFKKYKSANWANHKKN